MVDERGDRAVPGVSGWAEVADGIFQGRYQPYDVNVTVVRGADGLLVVDTRSSHREADEIRGDLTELGALPVRWVVNTHAHFDHTFGNHRFGPDSDLAAPIYGHERIPAHLMEFETPKLARFIRADAERSAEWAEVIITPPTELVGDRADIDLGDRRVELRHLGRGHTDNDLLLHVPAVDGWLVGDLIEESGPPMYAADCFPLEWPDTIAALVGRLGTDTVVVPGHGSTVGARFVENQLAGLRAIADLIRALHAAGATVEAARDEGGDRWPFPADGLADSVRRAIGSWADPELSLRRSAVAGRDARCAPVRRPAPDPRFALPSGPDDPEVWRTSPGSAGDVKLAGSAQEVTDPAVIAAVAAAMSAEAPREEQAAPPGSFELFHLDLVEVVVVRVDGGQLLIESWHEGRGMGQVRR